MERRRLYGTCDISTEVIEILTERIVSRIFNIRRDNVYFVTTLRANSVKLDDACVWYLI